MRIRHRRRARPLARFERLAVDDRRGLGDGAVLIEAGIVARLLGVRLLRLEADVVISPARAKGTPAGQDDITPQGHELASATDHTPAAAHSGGLPLLSGKHSLSQARLLLQESEESLARARKV